MTTFYNGRGKNGAGNQYIVRRNNIQSWVNRMGFLSLPEFEVRERIKKQEKVMFFDLKTHDRFITDASNFKNGEVEDGKVCVDIEKFDVVYARGDE